MKDDVLAQPLQVEPLPIHEALPAVELQERIAGPAATSAALPPNTDPFAAAAWILKNELATKSTVSLDSLAARQGVARSALECHLKAAAEACINTQQSVHNELLRYVVSMKDANALEPLLYVTHLLFDDPITGNSPCCNRNDGGRKGRRKGEAVCY